MAIPARLASDNREPIEVAASPSDPEGTDLLTVSFPIRRETTRVAFEIAGSGGESISGEIRLSEPLVRGLGSGRNEIAIVLKPDSNAGAGKRGVPATSGRMEDCDAGEPNVIEEAEDAVRSFRRDYLGEGRSHVEPLLGILSLGELDDTLAQACAIGRDMRSGVTALILGETGTGKELIAKLIHRERAKAIRDREGRNGSEAAEVPFVVYNCAGLGGDTNIQNSRLFGRAPRYLGPHDPGELGMFLKAAGYQLPRPGGTKPIKIPHVHEGVLFLDEIGDLPTETQGMLLRVLQDGVVEPLGMDPARTNVKVVFATNKAAELSNPAKFRVDLYYRIKEYALKLPALRDRRAIIPHLVYYFSAGSLPTADRSPEYLWDYDALVALSAYSWPGNVRELEKAVEKSLLMAGSKQIGLSSLSREILLEYERSCRRWSSDERELIEETAALARELFEVAWKRVLSDAGGRDASELSQAQLEDLGRALYGIADSKLKDLQTFMGKLGSAAETAAGKACRRPSAAAGTMLLTARDQESPKSCIDQISAWIAGQLRSRTHREGEAWDPLTKEQLGIARARAKDLLRAVVSRIKGEVSISNEAEDVLFRARFGLFHRFMGLTYRALS